MNVMQLCRESWYFFRQNLTAIFSVLIPSIAIGETFTAFVDFDSTSPLQSLLIWGPLLLLPIFQAALIMMLKSQVTGERLSVSDCYRLGAAAYLRLAAIYLCAGLGIMFGFILLVIPGLIIMSRLCIAEYYCLFEGKTAMDSLQASWQKTKEYQWPILGGYLLVMIVQALPIIAIDQLLEITQLMNPITRFLSGAFESVLISVLTVFTFRLYCEFEQKPEASSHDDSIVS
ncbi:hypothetical protein [Vibrio tapetis]|uniref:Glycerophosphoryl diester phosphodiesterase membrane domain-containing protein n=1 Tax=Vibrio tapetis subsp. tapetis TaxID=1671868 RepID=A0A2N8ZKW9_9VIBR|nr:hypothetical protein [Vibrio tapetis]SON52559.1 conserved membrane protein of unknown function [Vibrio tapetis subsp. tapetis]